MGVVFCLKGTKTKSVIYGCFHMYTAPSPHISFNLSVLAGLVKAIRGDQFVCAKNGYIRQFKFERIFSGLFEIRAQDLCFQLNFVPTLSSPKNSSYLFNRNWQVLTRTKICM